MKRRLRILITNNTLASRSGTELYVRDLCLGLLRRGHNPVAYSTVQGEVAAEMRALTVPVIGDLRDLHAAPDVIHGQHHLEAMAAMLHFPTVPAIYACHGWIPPEEQPPIFPSITHYVAVDELVRERLLTTPGLDAAKIRVQLNFVDMDRFRPRPPLPVKPQRALVLSNYTSDSNVLSFIRQACQEAGLSLDVAGNASGSSNAQPELLLQGYDVVFAKARAALEAMATGCAVIVADVGGLAGMVTPGNVEELRGLNFGVRTLQAERVSVEGVAKALREYDAAGALAVSQRIRGVADMKMSLEAWEGYYEEALRHEFKGEEHLRKALAAGSDYVRLLTPLVKQGMHVRQPMPAAKRAGALRRLARYWRGGK